MQAKERIEQKRKERQLLAESKKGKEKEVLIKEPNDENNNNNNDTNNNNNNRGNTATANTLASAVERARILKKNYADLQGGTLFKGLTKGSPDRRTFDKNLSRHLTNNLQNLQQTGTRDFTSRENSGSNRSLIQ